MKKPALAQRNARSLLEPIDLDLTPVMNMMLILIPLLVSMAVFTQIAAIRFSLPGPEGDGAAGETPAQRPEGDVDITLVLSEIGFQIIGEGRKLDPIPKTRGTYDFPTLRTYLDRLKREYPLTETVVLLIDTAVVYEDIIGTMDICRESRFPNVALSGGLQM